MPVGVTRLVEFHCEESMSSIGAAFCVYRIGE
jgi:hypothetical protein